MTRPLRVGVRWPEGPERRGGVEVYAAGLLRALTGERAGPCEPLVLLSGSDRGPAELPTSLPRTTLPGASLTTWGRRAEILRRLLPSRPSPRAAAIDALGLDVVHYPATRMDEAGVRTPTVLTFFDMQEEFLPAHFSWRERAARRIVHRRGVHDATVVIAPSHFTAEALVARYRAPAAKIRVIPPGVPSEFRPEVSPGEGARLRERHSLPPEYLLYAANPWPHKNHARLFAAMGAAGPLPPLVCTGKLTATSVIPIARRAGLGEGAVIDAGLVPAEDLPALLRSARGAIFPSLFEGFGLPVLEAMACGRPVACSAIPPLEEIADGVARLFDPLDVRAIAEALRWLASDDASHAEVSARGLERSRAFRWDVVVGGVREAYEVAARTSRG